MRGVSTFGAFTMARLGIYASQKGLDVTGNNISNINTTGYTRQVLDQISLRVGGKDRYSSTYDSRTGSGTLVTGISQIRDPYLDIRFRTEQASVGAMDAKLAGLEDLAGVLDEVADGEGDGILQAQFNDLVSQLQALSNGRVTDDSLVRSSADSLVKLFNNYASRLEGIKEDYEDILEQDVKDVNIILTNIRELNESIQKSEIHGDSALELRDERNLLIDQLSEYMKIDVIYEPVQIGAGASVDKLVIRTSGNPSRTIVDGSYAAELSFRPVDANTKGPNDNYDLDLGPLKDKQDRVLTTKSTSVGTEIFADEAEIQTKLADTDKFPTEKTVDGQKITYTYSAVKVAENKWHIQTVSETESATIKLTDTELYGALRSGRELLTEKGEFTTTAEQTGDANATTKRGIPYYQNALDALARKFAQVLNGANTGYLKNADGEYVTADGTPITYPQNADGDYLDKDNNIVIRARDVAAEGLTDDQKAELAGKNGGVALGGILFSTSSAGNETNGITAANISISKQWSTGAVSIQNSFVQGASKPGQVNSGDFSNIEHIIVLMDGKQEYKPNEIEGDAVDRDIPYFKGSFQEFLTSLQGTLAKDIKSTTTLLDNYSAAATELDTSRDSVSGVDLNDEAVNMMQYQKSYSAACRMMTTLDEALDKLINGTGVAGR